MLTGKMSRIWTGITFVLCAVFLSQSVFAATITLVGDDFDLSYDDTQSGIAIYGAPVYGLGTSNITFNQTDFNVTSSDGDGNEEVLASTVTFTLTRTNATFNFESLQLFEFGTYTMNGPGASVDLTGSMSVSTPAGIFGPKVDPVPTIDPTSDLTINDNAAHNWFGGAFADLTVPGLGFGGAPDAWNDENAIIVSINNILHANTTQGGTSAFIQKLQAGEAVQLGVNGSPASAAVPVPPAIWLMFSGLLGLVGIGRRKKGL